MNGFRGGARWLCGALSALALASSVTTAGAQYYDGPRGGYDRRAPAYEDDYAPPPPPRRRVVREVGYNCDAVQRGLTGPKPYSCPLPGPRPLGARCFCETPVVPLSGGDTVAGRVVP